MRNPIPKEIEEFLQEHRHEMDTPQVYLGQEPNTYHKDWDKARFKILIVAPYRYEDFRGNQTLPLLYQMINEKWEDVVCERAFFPNTEREYKLFYRYKIPIFSVESKHPMRDFDVIMTSLSFLPPWINFPLMLEMSGIPSLWRERRNTKGQFPLIMVGGSAVYGNFCITYPVVDLIYLGDAEDEEDGGVFQLLDMIMQYETLDSLQQRFDYIFCPSLYSPQYENEKFLKWEHERKYPVKLRRRICKDMNKVPMYTKPILSYTDTTMGLGEVEISRGCRGMCLFCGIGWKYRPYRERNKEVMVKALEKNRCEGGAVAFCPIATEFAYYSQKRGLIKDLLNISPYADPLSMRVDAFAGDPLFDKILAEAGMNQLALGVEMVSQRLRNRYCKGITEDDILTACQIAIDSGRFKRIKFFMISNVDETKGDFEEFFELLRKVVLMRETAKSKIRLKASWTPLFVEPCTPLQWKAPTITQRQNWKEVDKILVGERDEDGRRIKGTGLGVEFALGIKNEPNFLWMMQGMHLGDTRFAEAVVKATKQLERPFYVAFARNTVDVVSEYMKGVGTTWDYIMREKSEDEAFPWDIVDRGVKKETLYKLYKKSKITQFDNETVLIQPEIEECDLSDMLDYIQKSRNKPEFWTCLKYSVGEGFEIVPNTHWKAQIQRAGYKSGVPIVEGQIHFFSDRGNRNWYGGFDYCVVGTLRPLHEKDIANLNQYFCGMQVVGFRGGLKRIQGTWGRYVSLYSVDISGFPNKDIQKYKKLFAEASSIVVSNPETRYFSGIWKKKINLKSKEIFIKFFPLVSSEQVGHQILLVWLDHQVAIRAFLRGFFSNLSFQRILQLHVEKVKIGYYQGEDVLEEF